MADASAPQVRLQGKLVPATVHAAQRSTTAFTPQPTRIREADTLELLALKGWDEA